MGKHRKRGVFQVAAAVSAALLATLTPNVANADELDDLIDRLEEISHEASAKMEEIKNLEDEIAATEDRIAELAAEADTARVDVERASGERASFQHSLNGIAQSRYRNTHSEVVLTTLESGNPQAVIDRAAYLGSLSRSAGRTLEGLHAASRSATERSEAVVKAVSEAEAKRVELDAKRAELERERDELDNRVRDIEARVDSLSPDAYSRWVQKDNPIDVFGMTLPAAGSGVVSAAMAQLGKPYGWGATGPNAFDCSGLMVYAYAQSGKAIPRTSQAQLAGGMSVPLSQLQPGDIIGYYPGTTHVGMYIGDGMVVHASDYGIPIQVVPYNSMPITGAVRY